MFSCYIECPCELRVIKQDKQRKQLVESSFPGLRPFLKKGDNKSHMLLKKRKKIPLSRKQVSGFFPVLEREPMLRFIGYLTEGHSVVKTN